MADPNVSAVAIENSRKQENAIRAVIEKKPPPEIDFTLHTMEDGTQVSTLERVCKGMFYELALFASKLFFHRSESCYPPSLCLSSIPSYRGSSFISLP